MLQKVLIEETLFSNQKLIYLKLIYHWDISSSWILRNVYW